MTNQGMMLSNMTECHKNRIKFSEKLRGLFKTDQMNKWMWLTQLNNERSVNNPK